METIEREEVRLTGKQHFSISALWFAIQLQWGALLLIIIPSQLSLIAPQNKAQAQGFIVGIGALVAVIVPLAIGALSDRSTNKWGRRRPYLVVGTLINIVGLGVLCYAGMSLSLPLYFVGYLIVQAGNNVAAGAYMGVIPDLVPESQRGTASGWMASMTQSGTIIGALGAGVLMSMKQPLFAYLLIILVFVVFLVITVTGMRETSLQSAEPLKWRDFLKGLWLDPRKYPDFAWVWITRALFTLGIWTVQPFIQYYLNDVNGVDKPELPTSILLAVILAGATVTGIIGGKLSDRIGRKKIVYAANGLIAVMSIAFVFSHSLQTTYILGIIYGLGYGAYYSVDWALGCDVLPKQESAGKDMAIWHVSMVLPQTLGAPLGGVILSAFGQTTTLDKAGETVYHYNQPGYAALFCTAAFFLLLGAVLIRNVRGVR